MKGVVIGEMFFFNDTATTEIYTLSLHDALPISKAPVLMADGSRKPIIEIQVGDEVMGKDNVPNKEIGRAHV